jgi:hypothetical protein
MTTLPKQTSLFTEEKLISLPEGSPANPTQWRGSEKEQKMTATSGRRCLEQYERFNRPGYWAKMFPALLIGMEGWFSTKCRLIWKLRATRSHRFYFQLAVSTLPIKEKEFGLLPTPRTADVEGGAINNAQCENGSYFRENAKGVRWGIKLRDVVESGLLPTPAPGTHNRGMHPHRGVVNALLNGEKPQVQELLVDRLFAQELEKEGITYVETFRRGKMLPTPTADDNPAKNTGKRNQDSLQKRAYQETGKTSQLNPLFVTEMMGFPPDYLVLPFLSGETNQ